jgi:ribosomal protein L32
MKCPYCGATKQSNYTECSKCGRFINVEFYKGKMIVKPWKEEDK